MDEETRNRIRDAYGTGCYGWSCVKVARCEKHPGVVDENCEACRAWVREHGLKGETTLDIPGKETR